MIFSIFDFWFGQRDTSWIFYRRTKWFVPSKNCFRILEVEVFVWCIPGICLAESFGYSFFGEWAWPDRFWVWSLKRRQKSRPQGWKGLLFASWIPWVNWKGSNIHGQAWETLYEVIWTSWYAVADSDLHVFMAHKNRWVVTTTETLWPNLDIFRRGNLTQICISVTKNR